jgi:hypothetical protein
VEITTIKEPFHQQLEMELLMQLEKGEHTKKKLTTIRIVAEKGRTTCGSISIDGLTMARNC